MAKRVRCPCRGWPGCQLCHGSKFYDYAPGPRGWLPFPCPTCQGTRTLPGENGANQVCPTCQGEAAVDPAQPPPAGWLDTVFKIFFGA